MLDRSRLTHLRSVPPETTLARIGPLMPVLGITRIANVTGLDTLGIPVVMVCRPNSRSISVSQGKGLDLPSAKASGVMESVESYHAEHIDQPLVLGSAEDLGYTRPLVAFDKLPRPPHSPFTPDSRILWIEGLDLLNDERVWVPHEMVHLDYTVPLPTGSGCFAANSNGLASGNTRAEAISHGICEVIERDGTTLWHLLDESARAETRIDLDAIDDPPIQEVLAMFNAASVRVGAWETTTDMGIPAVLCRILDEDAPPSSAVRPASGMGCHPYREVALLRALIEAAQSRLTFISGARDDMPRHEYDRFLRPEAHASWRAALAPNGPVRDLRELPTWEGGSVEDAVEWELTQLKNAGIERVVVVDLTKPAFGVPVVRVVIPGLEGIDASPEFTPSSAALARLGRTA